MKSKELEKFEWMEVARDWLTKRQTIGMNLTRWEYIQERKI